MTPDLRWDLSPLYAGPDDPALARDEAEVDRRIEAFQVHRERLRRPDVSAEDVAGILQEYEQIRFLSSRLMRYAALSASAEEADERLQSLFARMQERDRLWAARIVFVELELRRLGAETLDQIASHDACQKYGHFIRFQASLASHTLSESEEQVILRKNVAGRDALVRFREELAGRLDFGSMTIDGGESQMTMANLIALQEHPDPGIRFEARRRLLETFAGSLPIFTFLYQNVVKDHGIEAELRRYPEPIDVENVPNEIPGEVVKALIAATRLHLPLLRDYYEWKRGRLGLSRMRSCDLTAPLPGASAGRIPWEASRGIVEKSFGRLGPAMEKEIGGFFDERRIDAGSRTGKRQGAFCAPIPGKRPYILMCFTENLGSLRTLAHELGHGVHFIESGSSQTFLQAYRISKVISETASEFGECLLWDELLETSENRGLRVRILSGEVERFIAVVYRQILYTEFELAAHERSAREPLTSEWLSDCWERLTREYYGPGVDLMESDRHGWSLVGHFVFNPFYCYSYAMSQAVVLALHGRYRREGAGFIPRYIHMLRLGWSDTPEALLRTVGIDLRGPEVYAEAFREFEARIVALRSLADATTFS